MPTRNVNLTNHWDRFVEARVQSGRFSNASEVVREGLRLLEERDKAFRARLNWLRGEAKLGFDQLDRGEGIEFESMDALADFIEGMKPAMAQEIRKKPSKGV